MLKGHYLNKDGKITHKIVGLTKDYQVVIEDISNGGIDKLTISDFNGAIWLDGYYITRYWGDDFNGVGYIPSEQTDYIIKSLLDA